MTCNPTPGHISREKHGPKSTGTPVFPAALFTTAKTWRQPRGMDKEDALYIHNGLILSL